MNQTLPAGLDSTLVHYDVFALHSRLHTEHVRAVMPPDMRAVTMLRRPAELFQSLYIYNSLDRIYKKSLQELLALPLEQIKDIANSSYRFYDRIGYNQVIKY